MPNLQTLSQEEVTQQRALVATLLKELNPAIDTRSGPIADHLIKPIGTLSAYRKAENDEARYGLSLKLARENPDVVSTEQVDSLLVDSMLTRKPGSAAGGSVLVVITREITVTVPTGGEFIANGRTFRATSPFIGIPSTQTALGEFDRNLTARSDGTFSFPVEVECTEDGPAGNLPKDTLLVPQFTIMSFQKAMAAEDFTAGAAEESNSELLSRQAAGRAAKTASNRFNNVGLILEQLEFENIAAMSIIGFGDAEMRRDTHSLLPFSFGARTDWYVRTAALPANIGVTKEATLVKDNGDGFGTWQTTFTRDEYPGLYDVIGIRQVDDDVVGGYLITEDIRLLDRTRIVGELLPDLVDTAEGVYTRYQTVTLRFVDSDTPIADLELGDKRDYAMTVRALPLLADIQSFVSDRAIRYAGGDALIKAPVPCFMSVGFQHYGRAGAVIPDEAGLKTAVADYVNSTGFPGRIYASALIDIIRNYLGSGVQVPHVDMVGLLVYPDGTRKLLRSTEVIEVPQLPDKMVTDRTVAFYLDPAKVIISGRTISQPEIL